MSRMLIAVNLQNASLVLAIVRNLVLRVSLLLLLPTIYGSRGIWLASPGTELLAFSFAVFIFNKNIHEFGFDRPLFRKKPRPGDVK